MRKRLVDYRQSQRKKLKKWYDNQDVCLRLNISLRTLQTMRNNGTLPYTQINRKMFYRPEDVEAFVLSTKNKKAGQYE
ncbi:hypothetical protein FACS189437_10630 [Bacteroidia bacterium]|nr:hypothetical protein FACS189437_10630 [Bacteroidia bacterium]